MKTFRRLIAIPVLLLGCAALVAALWNFGTALIFGHGGDLVIGFFFLGVSALLLVLLSILTPKALPAMAKIKTLTIPADPAHAVAHVTITQSLKALQEAVGGPITAVGDGPSWTAWAEEDGNVKHRPYNERATHAMAFLCGRDVSVPILGDVVICGHTAAGLPCDLDNVVAARAEELAMETGG